MDAILNCITFTNFSQLQTTCKQFPAIGVAGVKIQPAGYSRKSDFVGIHTAAVPHNSNICARKLTD